MQDWTDAKIAAVQRGKVKAPAPLSRATIGAFTSDRVHRVKAEVCSMVKNL